jgi:uncharacterized membrane protein YphA (DoxX/SURF4 family)
MKFLVPFCQIVIGCGLLNVWLLRFNQATAYRGGAAKSMLEEFAAYGLPGWFCYIIGVLKVGAALCLLAGLVVPALVTPAAALVAASAVTVNGAINTRLAVLHLTTEVGRTSDRVSPLGRYTVMWPEATS